MLQNAKNKGWMYKPCTLGAYMFAQKIMMNLCWKGIRKLTRKVKG